MALIKKAKQAKVEQPKTDEQVVNECIKEFNEVLQTILNKHGCGMKVQIREETIYGTVVYRPSLTFFKLEG